MSTSLEHLACNNCGAQLHVPSGANYVTCTHCNSQLVVRRDPTVTYTQKLDEIDKRTEQMAEDLAHLRRASEKPKSKHPAENSGEKAIGVVIGILGGCFAVIFGIFFATAAREDAAQGFSAAPSGIEHMPTLFGVFFVLFGVIFVLAAIIKASGGSPKDPSDHD